MDDRWRSHRQKHIEKISDYLEHDDLVIQYLTTFTDTSLSEINTEVIEWYRKAVANQDGSGLKGFCRVYPNTGQNVMVVSSNPKLDPAETSNKTANHKLITTSDMCERKRISMNTSYLSSQSSGAGTKMQNSLAELASSSEGIEDIMIEIPKEKKDVEDNYEDIYYTNYYKFATQNRDYIPDWADEQEYAPDWLQSEIESVKPNTIITYGGKVWDSFFRERTSMMSQTCELNPSRYTITEIEGSLLQYNDTDIHVIPLRHPSSPGFSYLDIDSNNTL